MLRGQEDKQLACKGLEEKKKKSQLNQHKGSKVAQDQRCLH